MNNKEIQLSKSLSWLLRHGVLKEGLEISPEGYVDVNKILLHKTFRGKYNKVDIEKVVQTNDKQRFTLRQNPITGALEIKANQGHSVHTITDAELIPILEPKYQCVVHGTYLKCWPQIKKDGLSCMSRRHIHLAKGTLGDKSVISGLRKDIQVYIFINLQEALKHDVKFYESENGVILTPGNNKGYLEPKYFSKVIQINTVIPIDMEVGGATASVVRDRGPIISPRPFPSGTTPGPAPAAASPAAKHSAPNHARPNNNASPRHQNNNQRKQRRQSSDNDKKEYSDKEDPLKIIVTGYPPYSQPQDLLRVFSKFGTVKMEKINTKFAVLSYLSDNDAATAILASKKVNVYGEFLTVRAYTEARFMDLCVRPPPKRDFSKSKQKGLPMDLAAIIAAKSKILDPKQLDLSGPFPVQLERLLGAVRLSQEAVAALAALYADLEHALQPHWPGCTAIPFGSITTGLGVVSSDADCFVLVPPQFRQPHGNFVNKAKRVLQQFPDLFAEILSIPRANTPIVKFFHVPTQTNCDLTFKTPLGTQNSKLIAFLLHSDPRLIPMAVVVKYWAKVHDFSGTGKLTNYALTLLIIFYLQQPPQSILPSVEWLQRDAAYDVVVDFWNTGFMDRVQALPKSSNTSSIAELIGGFFEYYSLFNFEEMAVCPFLGTPVKKDAFVDLNQLPAEFQRYRNNVLGKLVQPLRTDTSVCVQDPFEQSHNVAASLTGKLTAEVKAFFKFAANAYEKEKLAGCDRFLETVLLQKPKIVRSKSHPEYRVNLFPRIIVTIIDPDWKPIVRDLVFVIFEKILLIKLGKVEEKVNMDTKKEKEKYMGVVTKAIWKRKQFSRLYSVVDLGFLDKQAKITDEILKVDKQVISLQFQLTLTFCNAPRSAVVGVRLGAGDAPAFREFGKFFISVMQGWFLNLLKPYARPPEQDTAAKIADTIKMLDSNLDDVDSDDSFTAPAQPAVTAVTAVTAVNAVTAANAVNVSPASGGDECRAGESACPASPGAECRGAGAGATAAGPGALAAGAAAGAAAD